MRTAHGDKFSSVSHVDEIVGDRCHVHFKSIEHALADKPPTLWPTAKDWDLAQYLARSAAILHVPPEAGAPPAPMQVVHASQAARANPVVRLRGADGRCISVNVSGYHGLRTFLTAAPVRSQALRPPEWIERAECSERQWEAFALPRRRWEEAALCLAHAPPPALAPPAQALCAPNKSKITAYFPSAQPLDDPSLDAPRQIAFDRQSEARWSAFNRSAAVEISFDLTTMDLRPATLPDRGTWTVAARHGQAVLRQHPLPFRKHANAVKPNDTDLVLDAAHFATLHTNGCSEAEVATAILRQRSLLEQDPAPLTWSRPFTTYLALATEATTLWGCTGLTWDTQYHDFVSPDDLDVALGGTSFADGLTSRLHRSVIILDSFTTDQQDRLLDALGAAPPQRWTIIARQGADYLARTQRLRTLGERVDEVLPGQTLAAPSDGWATGNITPIQLHKKHGAYGIWTCGEGKPDPERQGLWDRAFTTTHVVPADHVRLSQQAADYYAARQDGAYIHCDGRLAACDGSAGGAMGAAAVFLDDDGTSDWAQSAYACRVGGSSSSFRAETAAMWLAVSNADPHTRLTVLTDSMNVINALQAWSRREFLRDMTRQLNADIMKDLLLAINARLAPLHIVKVKSHRGVALNEAADVAAGLVAVDDDADLLFPDDHAIDGMSFSWRASDEPDAEVVTAATNAAVLKRWAFCSQATLVQSLSVTDTIAGRFLTAEGHGRHLLAKSQRIRPWSTAEERTWMQLVSDVYPNNAYLRRIDKHGTGDCPWCPAGTMETNAHIQSCCHKYEENRTAAHHAVAKAVLSGLKDLRLPGWQFWYETPFLDLPFDFAWTHKDLEVKPRQPDRRPDGVAWHADTGTLYFLEFTRAWDEGDSLRTAEERKAEQYAAAETAVKSSAAWKSSVRHVDTLPFVFGVRGSVRHQTLRENLLALDLKASQCDRVIAQGIRATITEARQLCVAHRELAKTAPRPFGPHQRHQYTARGTRKRALTVPPKPARPQVWRRDRGWRA